MTSQFVRAMPVLDCSDMGRSIAFYRDALGFEARTWAEPVSFAILQRGHVSLALAHCHGRPAVSRNWAVYVHVEDVDRLYAELRTHGVAIADPPCTQSYNCRDFVVDDPDGHILSIGQALGSDPLGPGLSDGVGRDQEIGR